VDSISESTTAKELEEIFCARCEFHELRQLGRCPKGQTTCGAKITSFYTLNRGYAGLPANSVVTIKDIFWAMNSDYATVTITSTTTNQRFGVTYKLLTPR
jgi:hypothetical protein